MDFWLFIFCVLELVRFKAAEGGVAVGEEAESLAIVDNILSIKMFKMQSMRWYSVSGH